MKTVGTMAKTRFKGTERVQAEMHLHMAAYDLVRMSRLGGVPA